MSTKFGKRNPVIPPGEGRKGLSRSKLASVTGSSDVSPINQVVNELNKVDVKAPTAKLNKTTISDGNGRRIKLNDGTSSHGTNTRKG